MKILSFENRSIRIILSCILILAAYCVGATTARAQEYVAAGGTMLFDVSDDGKLVLQRGGFTISGMASTNMSVLNLATLQADPVNINDAGNFVNTVTGSMSGDGRYVAFQAGSSAIYVRDRVAGTSVNIIKTTDGQSPNGDVGYPRMSANGRYVLFQSRATNLVTETLPATSAFTVNMFLYDQQTGQISIPVRGSDGAPISLSLAVRIGLPGNQISADGRYVVFVTNAPNVHPDTPAGSSTLLYRRDLQTGDVLLLSRNSQDGIVTGNYSYPMISSDGNHVGFSAFSLQSDLAPGKKFGGVYIKEISTGKVTYMTENTNGSNIGLTALAGNFSSPVSMSGDGKHVAFNNGSQVLAAGNPGGGWAVFVSSINADGIVSMRRISLPEANQQQTSSNEGTNPIFARGSFAVAFQSRDRRVFLPGISPSNAPLMYTDASIQIGAGTPPGSGGGASGGTGATPVTEPVSKKTERVDGRPSTAVISGGIFNNQGNLTERESAPASLSIRVAIEPEPTDVGQSVQILVVVEVAGELVTLNSSGQILPFDENNLQFFTSRASISAKEEIELFNGVLGTGDRASYNIFVGYLRTGDLNQGNIIYNAQPIGLVIE